MALRDQPYIPLYVQDFLTDEKLNECSAETHGVYIKMMCIMHKSEEYGTILLKQKDKQEENVCLNFAKKLVKHLPFSEDTIYFAIEELINENVIQLDGDKISQKRMIKDNQTSLKRSLAGKKGGEKTQFAIASAKAKVQAPSENENEYVIDNENINISFIDFWNMYDKKVGKKDKVEKKWNKLKDSDRELIMEHIPKYKKSQPDKQFRKNPEVYLNNESWNDEIIDRSYKPPQKKTGVIW